MIYRILLFLFAVLPAFTNGQDSNAVYWFQFSDKAGTPYSIDRPSEFLSQKAIKRRQTQNIPIKKNDLPINPDYVKRVKAKAQKVLLRSKWFNGVIAKLKDSSQLTAIRSMPIIDTGYRVNGTYLSPNAFENDRVPIKKELPISYGLASHQIKMLNGHLLHQMGYKGQNVGIAILDAGFNKALDMRAFQHLSTFKLLKGTWDFVNQDNSVTSYSSHGAHVLSVIAGYLERNLMGTAPLASYWLLRSENTNSEFLIEEYSWLAAAEYADSAGAKIINSSLGYTMFDDSLTDHSYSSLDGNTTPVTRAADLAASKGMLVVSSAGNEGSGEWQYISAPADGDSVLSVGAVDSVGDRASFSSKGPTYDGRIKPEVVAQGYEVYVVGTDEENILEGFGTSFSSPLIAGMAACLWQAFPEATNMEIRNAIIESGSQHQNPDTLMGYGVPDFYEAYVSLQEKLKSETVKNHVVSYYPNPVQDYLNIAFYTTAADDYKLRLITLTGREVLRKNASVHKGLNSLALKNLSFIEDGLYLLVIENGSTRITKKLVVE